MYRRFALAVLAIVLTSAFAFSQGITDGAERQKLDSTFWAKYGRNSTIDWSDTRNCVGLLEGRFATGDSAADSVSAVRVAVEFLNENHEMLGTTGADLRLQFLRLDKLSNRYSVDFVEYYEDVRVERAATSVLLERDGVVLQVGNGYVPDIEVPVVPVVSGEDAVSTARQSYDFPFGPDETPSVELVIYPQAVDSTLVCRLAWRVKYIKYTYFIDAHDGSQIARIGNFAR